MADTVTRNSYDIFRLISEFDTTKDPKKLELFLDSPDVDLNIKKDYSNVLYHCIIRHSTTPLELVLDHINKFNKNIYDYVISGNTSLIEMLVYRHDYDKLKMFLKAGISPNYIVDDSGHNFLHKVFLMRSSFSLENLLKWTVLFFEYNGNISLKNQYSITPLDVFLSTIEYSNKSNIIKFDSYVVRENTRHLVIDLIVLMCKNLIENNSQLPFRLFNFMGIKEISDFVRERKSNNKLNVDSILNNIEG
jgi:hypothetical protein